MKSEIRMTKSDTDSGGSVRQVNPVGTAEWNSALYILRDDEGGAVFAGEELIG
jgi:hypothetical protein